MTKPSVIPGNNLEDLENVPSLEHWVEYIAECEKTKTHASATDYLVWLEERGLVENE